MTITETAPTTVASAIDVAVDTLAFIKANPDEWGQASWTRCFAGHFARLDPEVTAIEQPATCGCCDTVAVLTRTSDGTPIESVGIWFETRLGAAAMEMVDGSNQIADLEAGVLALKDGGNVNAAVWTSRRARLGTRGDDLL